MKSFKEFKSSLVVESEDGTERIPDQDVVFDIDNMDVDGVYDKDADTFMDDEEDALEEDALTGIKDIVKNKQAKAVKFSDGSTIKVDGTTANVLLKVIDALNDKNKEKFAELINKNKNTFMKAVDFAWSAVK